MTGDLKALGHRVATANHPDPGVLERIPNPRKGTQYVTRFTCPELTALCPVTGQPDFAHLVLDYIPDGWLLESKSLRLYLQSYRNHGAFSEECTVGIAQDIVAAIEPTWLRVGGYWHPRGGIPIDVFWQTGPAPERVWLPDQDVAPYRGRG